MDGTHDATGPSTNGSTNGERSADGAPVRKPSEIELLRSELEKSLQDAQVRLSKLPSGDARLRGQMQLHQLASAAGGSNVILQGINQRLTTVSEPDGNTYLLVTKILEDPQYMSGPWVRTVQFRKQPDANGWNPTPCSAP